MSPAVGETNRADSSEPADPARIIAAACLLHEVGLTHPPPRPAMNKRTQSKKIDHKNANVIETIETIETVELDAVTGGCSSCGCGQPDPAAAQQQLASSWLRR